MREGGRKGGTEGGKVGRREGGRERRKMPRTWQQQLQLLLESECVSSFSPWPHIPSSTPAGFWRCICYIWQNWDVGTTCKRLRHNLAGKPHLLGEKQVVFWGIGPTKKKTPKDTLCLQGEEFPQKDPSKCPHSKIQSEWTHIRLANIFHREPLAQDCQV